MDKRFWMFIGVICFIFVGFLVFHKNKNATVVSTGTKHILGSGSVKLIEYGDYQCPVCAEYATTVKSVQEKYGSKTTFQFKDLPLTEIHQNALAAMRASEAADQQGKFWEMHDLIFQNQTAWENQTNALDTFTTYAKQLGLDTSKFATDFKSSRVNDVINADISDFGKTGYEKATPTFILDGKQVQPQPTVDDFSKLIDAELAKTTK